MTKHNDQLLPCPFCGDPNPNLTHDDYVHDDLRPMPVVECTKCHTWVRAEAWNTRAQLPAGGAVQNVEKLREAWMFLDGQGELDGMIFGEAPEVSGRFWWRKHLRAALEPFFAAAPHPVSGEQKAIHQCEFGNAWMDTDEKGAAEASFDGYKTRIVYAAPPAPQDVSGLVEALEKISNQFPLGLVRQEFRVNGAAPIQADGDTEFLSYQKVNHIAGVIRSIAVEALAAHRAQAQGDKL